MPNKKDNQQLDEFIKQRISNYEPESASPDWSKMESLLGVVTKSESNSGSSFNMPDFSAAAEIIKKLISSYVFIAVIMLVAGATIFYFILKSPSTPTENTTESQLQTADTTMVDSVPTNTVNSTESPKEVEQKTLVDNDSLKKLKEKEEAEKLAKEEKEKELKAAKEEEEKKKALEKEEEERKEREKKAKEEKRKEEKKKEEKKKADKKEAEKKAKEDKKEKKEPAKETLKKSNSPIGLGNLMRSVNLDSIKKQQEKQEEQAKPANDTTQR